MGLHRFFTPSLPWISNPKIPSGEPQSKRRTAMKRSEYGEVARPNRGRVLARVLAEDLREVCGTLSLGQETMAGTFSETSPPPGRDITNVGADGDAYSI
jgi:hypothetical protein